MFREYLGRHAPTWIGDLSMIGTVFFCAIAVVIAWYVFSDRRRAFHDKMQSLPLDDGQPAPEDRHG